MVGSAATAVAHFVVIKRVEKEGATSTLSTISTRLHDRKKGEK